MAASRPGPRFLADVSRRSPHGRALHLLSDRFDQRYGPLSGRARTVRTPRGCARGHPLLRPADRGSGPGSGPWKHRDDHPPGRGIRLRGGAGPSRHRGSVRTESGASFRRSPLQSAGGDDLRGDSRRRGGTPRSGTGRDLRRRRRGSSPHLPRRDGLRKRRFGSLAGPSRVIPAPGGSIAPGIESLNVATAAAILLSRSFELRQTPPEERS